MKQVRLKKLSLTNYRNIEHAELDFQGRNAAIVGENHIGKTNTLESLFVLLDDSLLNGSSNLPSIKPLSDTKKTVSIEATFDVEGEDFAVRKDYGEDWVRTRGTDTLTLKGHFQTLYIQGVKVERSKDFYSRIREKFGIPTDQPDKIDYVRLLLAPTYLGEMGEGKDWTALRSFIIKLVGDVSDGDVFEKNPELGLIRDDLTSVGGSIEQLKKKYKQDIDGTNVTIIQKEAVISDLEKVEKPTDEDVAIAKRAIEEHEEAIAKLRSGVGQDVESERLQRELTEVQAALLQEQLESAKVIDPHEAKRAELRERYKQARDAFYSSTSEKSELLEKVSSLDSGAKLLGNQRELVSEKVNEELIDEIKKIDSAPLEIEEVCPTCGQRLQEEKIEEAKQKIIEVREQTKANLIEQCKRNKQQRAELNAKIEEAKAALEKARNELAACDAKIAESKKAMEDIEAEANALPQPGKPQENSREADLRAKAAEIEQRLKESRSAFQTGLQDTNRAIIEHQEAIEPYKKRLAAVEYHRISMERAESEKESLSAVRRHLATVEQRRECANQFLYAKLRLLDENVSKVFGNIRIKLIQENLNGGFDPICKPYIYDTIKGESTKVSWAGGSKSEKVETGIAICEAIKKALNLPNLPFLFDEGGEISSETFDKRLATEAQLICVKVRDGIANPTVLPL